MSPIFEFLFGQYRDYGTLDIFIEVIAVLFGLASVVYSMRNKIWVFPTGMVNTALFVYLLLKWGLLGDTMINAYYFIMSVYGWYVWTRKVGPRNVTPISRATKKEHRYSAFIFVGTVVFVFVVYRAFNKWDSWTAYVDTLTTAIFFVAMWLMAKRKIENWIYWIIGDVITVPLYFYKGLTFSSFMFLMFTFVAIAGYFAWKKHLNKPIAVA
ncbi:MAG: nicotinamide riboside transporter PnuC [Marinirhabdus sp.]